MKRYLFLLAAVILPFIQASCLEGEVGETSTTSPREVVSATISPVATMTPTLPRPLPTRNPGMDSEPVVSLNLVVPENALVNVQHPAFAEAEIVGWGVEAVTLVAGLNEVGGRQRVLSLEPLVPNRGAGGSPFTWREGVHELPLVWTAEADKLNDGANEEYVVLHPGGENTELSAIGGGYRRADGESYRDVRLHVDTALGAPVLVHDIVSGEKFEPGPGDEFRPDVMYLADDGRLVTELGMTLVFDAAKQIGYERQLLPAGSYFLGASAAIPGGVAMTETVDFIIEDVPLLPGYRAYLDPDFGFQFLYPAEWPAPTYSEGRLTTRKPEESIELNITILSDVGNRGADQLKRETIGSFGSIQVLFEDLIAVGEGGALRTAYGYDSVDGPHTGVFIILVDDETGYIIDVDGQAESEERVLEIVGVLTDSWTFRPVGGSDRLGDWAQDTVGGIDVAFPTAFAYALLENGWHRFSAEDADAFGAIRLEEDHDVGLELRHRHWLDVAGTNVAAFAASDAYEIERPGQRWIRSDFSYSNAAGSTRMGSITGKSLEGQFIFIWSEAPEDTFEAFERDVINVMMADARPQR